MGDGRKMISNQVLQNTIDGLKNITKLDFAISDGEGKALVSTFQNLEINKSELLSFAQSQADTQTIREYQFFKVYDELQLEYVLIVRGGDEENLLPGKMAAFIILLGLLLIAMGTYRSPAVALMPDVTPKPLRLAQLGP